MSSNKMSWHFHRKIWFSDGFLVPFLILPQAGDEVQNFSFAEQPFWTSKRARHFFHVVITWPSLYKAKQLTHSGERVLASSFSAKRPRQPEHIDVQQFWGKFKNFKLFNFTKKISSESRQNKEENQNKTR